MITNYRDLLKTSIGLLTKYESQFQEFYDIDKRFKEVPIWHKKWLEINDTDEDNYSDFYFEEYDKLISWTYQRTLTQHI